MQGKLYIISADDDTDDQDLIEEALKNSDCPHTFSRVQDGDKLLKLLDEKADKNERLPDIIFLDLNMPIKNGRDVLKTVKNENSGFKNIPVVVLTTSNSPADINFCAVHNADSYLVKPDNFNDLCVILKRSIAA